MSFDFELINGDIKIKSDGTVRTVSGVNKLKQDIIKIILTPLGSMSLHQWYGSLINDNIIGNVIPDSMLFEDIQTSVNQSLERLKKLQLAQASGQTVTNAELISSIEYVLVQRAVYDMRQVNVIVSVLTKELSKIEESFQIS